MKILITGSTGFLGKFLCQYLSNKDYSVIAHTRTPQVLANQILKILILI